MHTCMHVYFCKLMYVCMYVCMYIPFLLLVGAAGVLGGVGVGGAVGGRGSLDSSGAGMMKPYGGTLESDSPTSASSS